MTKKQYEEFLNNIGGPKEELKSYGGRMPDRMINKYGTWLRKNDPIAFEVGYGEYKLNQKQF